MESNIAEIMSGMEEMISRHYFAYARKFPEHREFWGKIGAEEIDHARWIRDLHAKAEQGLVSFNDKRFNKESLQELYSRLETILAQFQEQSKTVKDALTNSLKIESILLENEFFTIFQTDSPELKEVLYNLAEATKDHRRRMEEFLNKLS